jgi:hypothetical protein
VGKDVHEQLAPWLQPSGYFLQQSLQMWKVVVTMEACTFVSPHHIRLDIYSKEKGDVGDAPGSFSYAQTSQWTPPCQTSAWCQRLQHPL